MAKQIRIIKQLGKGAFGEVFLVKDGDETLAMKMIDMRRMDDEKSRRNCQEEANLFKRELHHPYILSYKYSFVDQNKLCIVTEYCPYGDLGVYLSRKRMAGETLDEPRLVEWFRQIASAVQFLHSKNIIHRDLKTNNIFLTSSWDTKLGDLGISKVLNSPTDMAGTRCGTPAYMSPEIFIGVPYNNKSDIWALGVLVYEMATLERPFDGFIVQHIMYKVIHGKIPEMPDKVNPELVELLKQMMQKMPDDRPTADDILKNKIFKTTPKPKPLPPMEVNEEEEDEEDDEDEGDALANLFKHMLGLRAALLLHALAGAIEGSRLHSDEESRESTMMAEDEDDPSETTMMESNSVMTHVFTTLMHMGHEVPKTGRRDHTSTLKSNMELLKVYILKVLDDNERLFKKACAVLDEDHDQDTLEEALIRVLGHEKFGLCGTQLLYYKNFSYNLRSR